MGCKTKKYSNGGFVGNGVDNSDPGKQRASRDSTFISENLNYARKLRNEANIQGTPKSDSLTLVKRAAEFENKAKVRQTNLKRRLSSGKRG